MSTLTMSKGAASGLTFWLGADAAITGLNAACYLLAAPVVVDLVGSDAGTVRVIGGFLLAFAGVVAVVAARGGGSSRPVVAVVATNATWALASLVVVATGALDLTGLGSAWVVAQAAVVGFLAAQQYRSLP